MAAEVAPIKEDAKTEFVFLAHGLSGNRWLMWPLSRRLRREGLETLNWGYRSSTHSCRYHAEQLANLIRQKSENGELERVHFVGHSMGCIVTRAALEIFLPPKMGRFVMLAPPNRGSHVATKIGARVRAICPTMEELGEAETSFVNRLAVPQGYEFGIIAAKFDWVIRRSKTRLPGEKDFSIIPCNHGLLPWHPQTLDQTVRFLKNGQFAKKTR